MLILAAMYLRRFPVSGFIFSLVPTHVPILATPPAIAAKILGGLEAAQK
jgi:hypothetical protein